MKTLLPEHILWHHGAQSLSNHLYFLANLSEKVAFGAVIYAPNTSKGRSGKMEVCWLDSNSTLREENLSLSCYLAAAPRYKRSKQNVAED